jgi:hypothetical protein
MLKGGKSLHRKASIGILDPNEVFKKMMSEAWALKRPCEHATRLPVRLSMLVNMQEFWFCHFHA